MWLKHCRHATGVITHKILPCQKLVYVFYMPSYETKPFYFSLWKQSWYGDGVCDKSFCHDWGRDARLVACCFIKMLGSGKCSAEAEYFCHHWTYYMEIAGYLHK